MLFRTGKHPNRKTWCSPTSGGLDLEMKVKHYKYAEKYVYPLHDNLFANIEPMFGTADGPFTFQQDNAYIKYILLFEVFLFCHGQHKALTCSN